MELRARLAMVLMTLTAACVKDTSGPGAFPVSFVVTNHLMAPVTISIDAIQYVTLNNGASTTLTVSSAAQWLTWTSAKPLDSHRQLIPDDIGEIQISVSGIDHALEIINVIGDQPYITARFFNSTPAPVSIGVYDGSAVACVAELPAAAGAVSGYTQMGYYKLLTATEVRAYRDPSLCTGPYVSWPSSEIKNFNAKSGLLTLSLDSAP